MLRVADETGYAGQVSEARSNKSGRTRYLPIKDELRTVLDGLPKIDAYVFHGPRKGRLKPGTVLSAFKRDVIAPLSERFPRPFGGDRSFEDGRIHSFRHYFCSTCADAGVPEFVLREWLGHADSAMVRHYYHLRDRESRRSMDQLPRLGGSTGCSDAGDEPTTTEE